MGYRVKFYFIDVEDHAGDIKAYSSEVFKTEEKVKKYMSNYCDLHKILEDLLFTVYHQVSMIVDSEYCKIEGDTVDYDNLLIVANGTNSKLFESFVRYQSDNDYCFDEYQEEE